MYVLRNRFRDYSFIGEANTPVLSMTVSYLSFMGNRVVWLELWVTSSAELNRV